MTECAVSGRVSDLRRTCRPCHNRIRGMLPALPEAVVQCWMARHRVQGGTSNERVPVAEQAQAVSTPREA